MLLSENTQQILNDGSILSVRILEIPGLAPATRYRAKYPNGYEVSIVNHGNSYGHREGLWEVALMHGEDFVSLGNDNVMGWLTEDDVIEVCELVKNTREESPNEGLRPGYYRAQSKIA